MKKTKDKNVIGLSLDIEIIEYLKSKANEEDRKISNLVNLILKNHIKGDKNVNSVNGLI